MGKIRVQTVFDQEQWNWKKADELDPDYIFPNIVTVQRHKSAVNNYHVYVNIPADFFRYFRAVHPDKDVQTCSLYLKVTDEGGYVFGYAIEANSPGNKLYDHYALWTYNHIPDWLKP